MIFDLREDAEPVVPDARSLAVHHLPGAYHPAAERLADRLMAQAYAQDRHFARHPLDQRQRDSGLVRRARSRGQHDVRWREHFHLGGGDLVVSEHAHLGAQLAQVLHEVVGKRVVVVDHGDHAPSPEAASAAISSARALWCVSCHSAAGSESATTPAAACTCSLPSLTTAVRMAMATSMSPLKPR